MAKQKRLFAEAVSAIHSLDTEVLVGWVYRWNNGDLQTAWLTKPQARVFSEPPTSNVGSESSLSAAGVEVIPRDHDVGSV